MYVYMRERERERFITVLYRSTSVAILAIQDFRDNLRGYREILYCH